MWEGLEPAVPPANRGLDFSAKSHFMQVKQPHGDGRGHNGSSRLSSPPQSSARADSSQEPTHTQLSAESPPEGQRPLGMVLVVDILTVREETETQEVLVVGNNRLL